MSMEKADRVNASMIPKYIGSMVTIVGATNGVRSMVLEYKVIPPPSPLE